MMTEVTTEYHMFDPSTNGKLTVRESGEVPELTDILYTEPGMSKPERITIYSEDIPRLMAILQKRYNDHKEYQVSK